MAQKSRARSTWIERADGSRWLPVELNGAQGIVALVKSADGGYNPTVLFEMPNGQWQFAEEAEAAVADWLAEIGARIRP